MTPTMTSDGTSHDVEKSAKRRKVPTGVWIITVSLLLVTDRTVAKHMRYHRSGGLAIGAYP